MTINLMIVVSVFLPTLQVLLFFFWTCQVEMKDSPDGSTTFVLRSMYDGESDSQRLVSNPTSRLLCGGHRPTALILSALKIQCKRILKRILLVDIITVLVRQSSDPIGPSNDFAFVGVQI